MALDFDQLRDSILPLGVDPATQTWGMEKVLEDVRMAEDGSPASVIKYNLSDEQKATFLNGILDLCGYVCQPSTGKTDGGDDVVIDIASAAPATSTPVSLPSDQDLMEGIERIRVASKLRDLHGLFESQLLFDPFWIPGMLCYPLDPK